MARKVKTATAAARGISKEELVALLKEQDRQMSTAAEYSGRAGQVIKTAVEKHNLNVKALRSVVTGRKMEVTKRQDFFRSFIDYAYKDGWFDSIDAFDDVLTDFQTIIDEVRARSDKPRKADSVIASVLQ